MNGAYFLRDCMHADYYYRVHVQYFEMEREHIYAASYPSWDTEQGRMVSRTLSIDKAVILLEEAEERFKRNTAELIEKRKRLLEALKILNEQETAVFRHIVWGESLTMPEQQKQRLNEQIYYKLCNYFVRSGQSEGA